MIFEKNEETFDSNKWILFIATIHLRIIRLLSKLLNYLLIYLVQSKPKEIFAEGPIYSWFYNKLSQQNYHKGFLPGRKKLNKLLENSNEMIFTFSIKDNQIQFIEINEVFSQKLGFQKEKLLTKTFKNISDQKLEYDLLVLVTELTINGKISVEWSFKTRDNREIPVHLSMNVSGSRTEIVGLGIAYDLTEYKKNLKMIRSTLMDFKDFKYALDQSALVSVTDRNGILQYINDKLSDLSKYERSELVGKNKSVVKSGYHSKDFYAQMWNTILSGKIWNGDIKNKKKDGTFWWVNMTIVPFLDEGGEVYKFITIGSDITERKLAEEKISYMAYHDDLTNLPNRLMFYEILDKTIKCSECCNQLISVIFIDIDRFKYINDSLGHEAGDRLIQMVAERLKMCFEEHGLLCRIGGDEFTAILVNISNVEIIKIIEEVRDQFFKPFIIQQHELFITVSIGISLYPADCNNMVDLIGSADMAMYYVKIDGGNNYKFFDSKMKQNINERMFVEKELRKAIERDELTVYFQPQVNMQTGTLVGTEVLIRWNHPEWGLIQPNQFIPIAEETGLIHEISERVLRKACTQIKVWQNAGYPPLRFAVNLSAQQFKQISFVHQITEILKESGVEPCYLELEVTEGIAMQNSQQVLSTLQSLVNLGITISIDDFGTGYSSLSYLKKFPFHKLKIDRSFVNSILEESDNSAITTAILQIADSLNLEVIAEGIETEEQLNFLLQSGCRIGQGYFFGKPVEGKDFEKFFAVNFMNEIRKTV